MSHSAGGHTSTEVLDDTHADRTISELFDEQVAARPDAVAVTCGEISLTYRELDERAGRLAALLPAGRLVVLVQDRSEHLLISMLAVLRAGSAYVPVEPGEPDERIRYVIADTNAAVVLTLDRLAGRISSLAGDQVDVMAADDEAVTARTVPAAGDGTVPVTGPASLAYVIYTSGTTGRPKGVMVEHRSVVNYVRRAGERIGLGPATVSGFSTSFSFDLTVTTTVACLALGGRVAVFPGPVHDLDAYLDFLARESVTFIKVTPSFLGLVAGALPAAVDTVVVGGEKLSRSVLGRISAGSGRAVTVFDEYGPTEATVGVTLSRVYPDTPAELSVGQLYAGCRAFVLDEHHRPVAVGQPGELFIGGICLARGYLHNDELTADRFVDAGVGMRVYRTGDLMRRLPDGSLQYLGRNDSQVKIRGYRVEPDEITEVLREHGDVADAVVLYDGGDGGDGERAARLVAYVVAGDFGCSEDELGEYVSSLLPEYMWPGAYVFLDRMPLTANGKLDVAALPRATYAPDRAAVPPRDDLERTVHAAWSELLGGGAGSFGVTDDFYQLGGDSIIAIQLLSRLRRRTGVHIAADEMLHRRTIERLADLLRARGNVDGTVPAARTESGEVSGEVRLLPIQRWFFDEDFAVPQHWNQAFLIRTPELDVERLRECVTRLGQRHPALRLRFDQLPDATVVQHYTDSFSPPELVVATAADDAAAQDICTEWQSGFSLSQGPVHRIGYLSGLPGGGGRIMVACHHLVVDAISWRVLAEDLEELYRGGVLPTVTSSYRQWTQAIHDYPETHADERPYWDQARKGFASAGEQALHRLVAGEDARTGARLTLDATTTTALLRDANRAYHTQINDVLLAAFAHALADVTGQAENHIILEGHGREEIDPGLDVSRTVGWFTTMFPIRLVAGDDRQATLRTTKEMLRAVPAKGIGYGALYGYHKGDLPRINFNYLGRFGAENGRWAITGGPAGTAVDPANRDSNIMTVDGWIADGCLTFTFVTKLAQETADLIARQYRTHLVTLIDELARPGRSRLTPSDVAHVVPAGHLDEIQSGRDVEGVFLANSLQEGFIFHAAAQGHTDDAYIVQMVWRYDRGVDVAALQTAWAWAQRKFATLRLRFGWRESLVQIIDARGTVDWRIADLTHETPQQQEESLRRIRESDRAEAYDLAAGSLFRLYLTRLGPERYALLFSHHHAILDGWSITVLLDYVHDTYRRLIAGEATEPAADGTYAESQRYLQAHRDDHAGFWAGYVAGADERTDLQALLNASARGRGVRVGETRLFHDMRESRLTVTGDRLQALTDVARRSGTTSNAVLLYVWHHLLALYGGPGQTVSGVVLSGRGLPLDDIEDAVGLFINTVPLILNRPDPATAVRDGIREVQQRITEFNGRSTVGLSSLHQGSARLFDSLFIYENWPKLGRDSWQTELAVTPIKEYEKLDYPLTVIVAETPDRIDVRLNYAADLFDGAYLDAMADTYDHLLRQVTSDIDQPVAALEPASPAQRRVVEAMVNPSGAPVPAPGVFHERFERQARLTPDATAVVFRGQSLTYQQLDERAGRLAGLLGRRSGELVVICMEKRAELIVAMLAVLKSAAAYVLLDTAYPDERIGYVLADTRADVVLTVTAERHRLETLAAGTPARMIALDDPEVASATELAGPLDPAVPADPADLMYVLYTSGTTGVPKGVMIEHRAYSALLDGVGDRHFGAGPVDTYSVTNHVFDIFGLEYGLPLVTGGRVELAPEIPEALDCAALTFLQMTPSVCDVLLDRLSNAERTLLLVGGESLSRELLERIRSRGYDAVNVYGPTETTIWSTSRRYDAGAEIGETVGLGVPFPGERVHLLDGNLHPVPLGATGELFISGVGLARGYLNRHELTRERFVGGSGDGSGPRLYRTGDLVRLRADGELEFVGRNDVQVKIRGHRIEPGEIEAALTAHPAVTAAVVLATTPPGRPAELVGYYVGAPDLDPASLTRHLRVALPAYLIPAALVPLDSLPLTISGKLDRSALPVPDLVAGRTRTPARSGLDEKVAALFARLLGHPEGSVGIDDDFFDLGGNSILSMKLTGHLGRELGLPVSLKDLLGTRTVRGLVDSLATAAGGGAPIPLVSTGPDPQLLSYAQERLWFIEQFEGGTTAYNLPLVLEVGEDVDTARLIGCVHELVRIHEPLRTLIKEGPDGRDYQVVSPMPAGPWPVRRADVAGRGDMLDHLRAELGRTFDLTADFPVRVLLYRVVETGRSYLSFVFHHVAFDGWSTDVLLQDMERLYHRAPREPAVRYRDFAVWQRAYLAGDHSAALLQSWRDRLAGYEDLALVTDHVRSERKDHSGANLSLTIDADTAGALRRLARDQRVSLFSVLLSGYYVVLRCFSGQNDLVVGTPTANRDHPQISDLIGFFVNTLPVRARLAAGTRLTELIQQTGAEVLEVLRLQDLPFEHLVDALDIVRDASRHPVFQTVFGVQSFGARPTSTLRVAPETEESYTAARFDLTTMVDDGGAELHATFNYATALFEPSTIASLARTYEHVLRQFAGLRAGDGTTVGELSYLGTAERDEIIGRWGTPEQVFETPLLLHEMVEEQARVRPEAVAVVGDGFRWTYERLDAEANRLAGHLCDEAEVVPGALVLLCLDRGADWVTAILGVLKTGAAYVPVDPAAPADRIAFLVQDTGAATIVVHRRYAGLVRSIVDGRDPEDRPVVVVIDDPGTAATIQRRDPVGPGRVPARDSLAYVIYTSGTTGVPKGVPQTHSNVARLFSAGEDLFRPGPDDAWSLFHSYVFDLSVFEMWGALLYGGRLVLVTCEQTRDPALFHELCRAEGVTVVTKTPTALYQFITAATSGAEDDRLDRLRFIVLGGEALNVAQLKPWFARYDGADCRIVNMYGITETTVHVTYRTITAGEPAESRNVGRPLPDMRVYLLNDTGQPVPVGAAGEIHVGGAGVAPGYLKRPELTRQRFVTDPFAPAGSGPMYRSGDLARWTPDGDIEYLGRNDFQVKIRGHRIEPGEVEAALSGLPGVRQCVVLPRDAGPIGDPGSLMLVGYYVSETGGEISDLFAGLRSRLPGYMVPAALVHLAELPRTVNGKLDRGRLPDPVFAGSGDRSTPLTPLQTTVRDAMSEILGVPPDQIGPDDDFFALGGNSIQSVRLARLLNTRYGVDVRIAALFKHSGVGDLAGYLATAPGRPAAIRRLGTAEPEQVLSFAQESLWFIDQYEQGTNAYNVHYLFEVAPDTDLDLLERAIRGVTDRQEILRTTIRETDEGDAYPHVLDTAEVDGLVRRADIADLPTLHARVNQDAAHRFDLTKDAPFRAVVYAVGTGPDRAAFVVFVAHHIAFDGWSLDLLLREVDGCYHSEVRRAAGGNPAPDLPELSIQYRDYATWQRRMMDGALRAELLAYWHDRLAGRELLRLPADHPRPPQFDYRGATIPFEIDVVTSRSLRQVAVDLHVSLFSVLLAGYYLMLAEVTGQRELVVGVPVFNRRQPQSQDLIGCFVNTLAVDTEVPAGEAPATLVNRIAARLVDAQEHQELPFALLAAALGAGRDKSRHPVMQVWFDVNSFGRTGPPNSPLRREVPWPREDADSDAHRITQFDLSIVMDDSGDALSGTLTYAASIFEAGSAERFLGRYHGALEVIAGSAAAPSRETGPSC